MSTKDTIRALEQRREELRRKVDSIRVKRAGVPPFSAWAKNILEGVGDTFGDYRDDVYIKNLKRQISAMQDYIRKFG